MKVFLLLRLKLRKTHWCASSNNGASILLRWFKSIDTPLPMCSSVLLANKTLVIPIWNGIPVCLIDIYAQESVLLFVMGALTIGALVGEDVPILFVRFLVH